MIIGKSYSQIQIFRQFLNVFVLQISVKLEMLFVELSHVFVLHHLLKVFLKLNQLGIFSTEVRKNGDAILQLKNVRIRCIIN